MTKNEAGCHALTQPITEAFMAEVRAAWPAIVEAQRSGDLVRAEEMARRALDNAVPEALSIFERVVRQ